jgi:uncharacterized protein
MTMKKGATQAVSSMNQAMMSCCISTAFSARLAGAMDVYRWGDGQGSKMEAEDADGDKTTQNDNDNRPPGRKGQVSSGSMKGVMARDVQDETRRERHGEEEEEGETRMEMQKGLKLARRRGGRRG